MRNALVCFLVLAFVTLPNTETASAPSLLGSWSGAGKAYPASGEVEPLRCSIRYEQSTGRTFLIHVKCAHSNGTFKVSGRIVQMSESHYSGRLYSDQYDVAGEVSIRVSGNRQTLNAKSPKGAATIVLTRR
jgi:uncharacterized protein YraI